MFQFKPMPSNPKPYITPYFWNNRTTNLHFMYARMHHYVLSWRRWKADDDKDLLRCLSKVKNARPLLHPVLVVRNDSCYPGLLEHHLWHPYCVSPLLLDIYLPAKKKKECWSFPHRSLLNPWCSSYQSRNHCNTRCSLFLCRIQDIAEEDFPTLIVWAQNYQKSKEQERVLQVSGREIDAYRLMIVRLSRGRRCSFRLHILLLLFDSSSINNYNRRSLQKRVRIQPPRQNTMVSIVPAQQTASDVNNLLSRKGKSFRRQLLLLLLLQRPEIFDIISGRHQCQILCFFFLFFIYVIVRCMTPRLESLLRCSQTFLLTMLLFSVHLHRPRNPNKLLLPSCSYFLTYKRGKKNIISLSTMAKLTNLATDWSFLPCSTSTRSTGALWLLLCGNSTRTSDGSHNWTDEDVTCFRCCCCCCWDGDYHLLYLQAPLYNNLVPSICRLSFASLQCCSWKQEFLALFIPLHPSTHSQCCCSEKNKERIAHVRNGSSLSLSLSLAVPSIFMAKFKLQTRNSSNNN